jgi:hypothetical protein
MIDMATLERAFAPVEAVGRQEITFEVVGQSVTLRPLLPREEVAIQKYAKAYLDEEADEKGRVAKHTEMGYFDRFRTEVLAYSVVQINDLNLRGVDYVATGQKTDKNQPVRVPRHIAVRTLITEKHPWSRPMLELGFSKYTEMMERIEQEFESLVEYEPADLKAEIDRSKKRLTDLEAELTKRAKGDPNLMAEQVEAIKNATDAQRKERVRATREANASQEAKPQTAAAPPPEPEPEPMEPEPEPEPEPAEPAEPEWADFDAMPTPADLRTPPSDLPADPEGPVVSKRTEPRQPIIPPRSDPPTGGRAGGPPPDGATRADPLGDVLDSFQDPEDEGVMRAEEERILEARRQVAKERAARSGGEAVSTHRAKIPPHLRGHVRENAVSLDAVPAGTIGDAPAFRLPAETLSERGRGHSKGPTPDQVSDGTKAVNPHFKPAPR